MDSIHMDYTSLGNWISRLAGPRNYREKFKVTGDLKNLRSTSIIILKNSLDSTQFSLSFYQASMISIDFDQESRKPNRF